MIQNMGRRLKTTSRQMLLLCGIVLGMASMAMQSCSEAARDDRPALCGNWESVEGKPDVLIYKEVWIGLGGTQSAVYATEVSAEEYLAYTTEETEKVEVYRLAEQLGGDIEAAIRQLAEKRRSSKT